MDATNQTTELTKDKFQYSTGYVEDVPMVL